MAIQDKLTNRKTDTIRIDDAESMLDIARGKVEGMSFVHKFGAGNVGTSLVPITQLLKYETPTSVKTLEVVSDDANDTSAGSGAQEVTVIGLDANWNEVTQTKELNGLTAVVLDTPLIRMHRWFVSRSGTYATAVAPSHVGSLTIQEETGGTTWDTIPVLPVPLGQSHIGVYTIPAGKTGYILATSVFTDTGKTADVFMFYRNNADDVTTPYTGTMRLLDLLIGVKGTTNHPYIAPKNSFEGPCDIGFMGKVASGTANVSIDFELLLVDV